MKKIIYLKVTIAIIIIAISAQLTIQVGDIPITGQTLAILTIAFFLNPIESAIATAGYLFLGALGLPIFADGASGISKLTGGSGGFLISFVVACTFISWWNQHRESITLNSILFKTTIGTCIILMIGVSRLAMIHGLKNAIAYGFTPFWVGALIKIIVGSILVWLIKRYAINDIKT